MKKIENSEKLKVVEQALRIFKNRSSKKFIGDTSYLYGHPLCYCIDSALDKLGYTALRQEKVYKNISKDLNLFKNPGIQETFWYSNFSNDDRKKMRKTVLLILIQMYS
jgi:type IV secretory pathway TraG/TraD family ATPase VirD4